MGFTPEQIKGRIYSNYSWWMNGFLMTDDMKYIKNGNLKLLII